MAETLRSVGIDVGTTSTQLVFSELTIENRASAFSVPEMEIAQRKILYQSPIHFTPLLQGDLVDSDALRNIVAQEYASAGIRREQVDTGAIIVTGETSRKENAAAVLAGLSDFAGDFVVATAGPDLESRLAAQGAGAVAYSEATGKNLLHMDIGGGTSNLALIESGRIVATGCLNVGGRLLKLDASGRISYISPAIAPFFAGSVGQCPSEFQLQTLAETLVNALEMAAGLQPPASLLAQLWTKEAGAVWDHFPADVTLSFSGGVADCIEKDLPDLTFGDIGPCLGRAIRNSALCRRPYHMGKETIRATVIGAGNHTTQLSGSTVFHQNISFPLKNLPVVTHISQLTQLDTPGALALPGIQGAQYSQVTALAEEIIASWPDQPMIIVLEADMAKALGNALALRLPAEKPILCIDRIRLQENSYLDVGMPISAAIPVVVKTLILNQ